MQQYAEPVLDLMGNVVPGALVTILNADETLATIFDADGVTTLANPVTADTQGVYTFKARNGNYLRTVSIGGNFYYIPGNITLNDPVDALRDVATELGRGDISSFAAGTPSPGVLSSFQATAQIGQHAYYGFLDNSTLNYSTAAFQAHSSFNNNIKIVGTRDSDHHHGYQEYTHYQSSGLLGRYSSFWSQLDHTGTGIISEASIFKASNPLGSGQINNLYGLYIEPLTRGSVANYAVYSPGAAPVHFGGSILLGTIGTVSLIRHNATTNNLDLSPRPGYSAFLDAPLLLGQIGNPAQIKYNANTGNLDIAPRAGYNTKFVNGALLVNADQQAGEATNFTGDVPSFLSRFYNGNATPKGIALVYTGAAPNSTDSEFLYFQDTVGLKMKVQSNGNVVNANNSYGALSDLKLKENIVAATPKLDDLMSVRIVNYNMKGQPKNRQIGVIAQELETVFPSMVESSIDRDEDGNDLGTTTKSVKYSVFVPILIKALQELKAEFDAYKAANESK